MSNERLSGLCQRVRPELACLGDLGQPLVDVITVVERVAGECDVRLLSEPAFALDVLASAGCNADPVMIGRLLDFLRQRIGAEPARFVTSASPVTVAEAVNSRTDLNPHGAARSSWSSASRIGLRVPLRRFEPYSQHVSRAVGPGLTGSPR